MTTLCIIRHGETDWNIDGRFQGLEEIELNETGKKQSLECTKYLKNFKWDLIVTSPLKRAMQTADIISKQLNIKKIDVLQGLIERDFGSASGLLPEEREKRFPTGEIPDAETKEHTTKRSMDTLKLIDDTYTNKNVIVVTHGGVIKSIIGFVNSKEFDSVKEKIKNASITVLKGRGYEWKVKIFNY